METKLTLKLNAEIIEEAKLYAKKRMVNPIVKSLTGIITLDNKKDYRESYTKYLINKYK